MNQRLIILRGAAASGKTTIAKSYRDFDSRVVWLKVDNFKDFFAEDASPALEYVNGSALATLKYLFEQEFSVVMDGVFQDTSAIIEAVNLANQMKIPVKVFELEVSLEALNKRDLIREGVPEGLRKPMGKEALERIYKNLQDNPYKEAIKLNTEENSLEECKRIIDQSF